MEISQLEYFCLSAKLGHITRAAERLHVAQPAVSRAIHKLESELGVPLFKVSGRNIVLTQYGRAFFEKAEPVLMRFKSLPDEMNEMKNGELFVLRMNVLAVSRLVTKAIIDYKNGGVQVSYKLSQQEQQGEYDVSVHTGDLGAGIVPDKTVSFSERILLAVPAQSEYAEKKEISLFQMRNESFIVLAGSKQFRAVCDGYCALGGFTPKIAFESDNQYAVQNLIAAGAGVGFWPEYSWGEIDSGAVRLLNISEPECKRTITADYFESTPKKPGAERFYSYLCSYFKKSFNR